MIARIAGNLVWIEDTAAGVELAGVGLTYEVFVPRFLAQRLADERPSEVCLWTRQHIETVGTGTTMIPRLIGFASADDRRFFELLTSVKGVGSRKALKAMAIEPALIARAIADRDAKALVKLPEIGKRLAETIIAELTGKVDSFLLGDERGALDAHASGLGGIEPKDMSRAAHEAIAALLALGEAPEQAEHKVRLAMDLLGEASAGAPTADELLAVVFAGRRADEPPSSS